MIVVKEMQADISRPDFVPRLTCVQGDSGQVVKLTLFKDGTLWEVPYGSEVVVRYQNARGEGGSYDSLSDGGRAYELLENGMHVNLLEQTCAVAGLTRVQVVLIKSGWQVTVAEIQLVVLPASSGEKAGTYVNLSNWLKNHGITPKKGEDYWTQEDVAEIQNYIDTRLGVIENGAY